MSFVCYRKSDFSIVGYSGTIVDPEHTGEREIEVNIIPNLGGSLADYGFIKISDEEEKNRIGRRCELVCDANGAPIGINILSKTLDELKQNKINQLNVACGEAINGYFQVEVCGGTYQFSYDAEAQSNFKDAKIAFTDGMINSISWTAHKDGKVHRISLNASEFNAVYYAGVQHKQDQISKFRDILQPKVLAATTKEEIDAINW